MMKCFPNRFLNSSSTDKDRNSLTNKTNTEMNRYEKRLYLKNDDWLFEESCPTNTPYGFHDKCNQ